jgi:hypothetical protein
MEHGSAYIRNPQWFGVTFATRSGLARAPIIESAGEPNSTIEPTLAALGYGSHGVQITAGVNDADDRDFRYEIDRQMPVEWNRAGHVRIVALRTERQRNLNEENGREAKEVAMVCRVVPSCDKSRRGPPRGRGIRCDCRRYYRWASRSEGSFGATLRRRHCVRRNATNVIRWCPAAKNRGEAHRGAVASGAPPWVLRVGLTIPRIVRRHPTEAPPR